MEKQSERIGKIAAVIAFLCTSFAFAQAPVLSADDTRVAPGDPVTITLSTTVGGDGKIDYPLEFTPDFGISEGMESVMDHLTGKVKTSYFIQQRGTFTKKGKFTFYAFVRYKGRNIRSNALTITVSEDALDNSQVPKTGDPIYGLIQSSKKTVYEGEPLLMRAKVFSQLDIYNLEGYSPFSMENNAEKHVFQSQLPNFRLEKVNGKQMLTLEFGSQLVFPVKTGKARVAPFEMSLLFHDNYLDRQVAVKSRPLTITVKPLPNGTPADFIGAVGSYELSQELGKTDLSEGDVFELKLTVSGKGNLHNTNPPVLNLPNGCTVYGDPKREDDYIFTEEGVEGKITYTYNIALARTGKIEFGPQSISYFDIRSESYKTVTTPAFGIEVKASGKTSAAPKGVKAKPRSQPPLRAAEQEQASGGWIFFAAGGIALLALLYFLLRRKSPGNTAPVAEAEIVTPKQEVATRDFWKELNETSDNDTIAQLLPKAIIAEMKQKSGKTTAFTAELLSEAGERGTALKTIIDACEHYKYAFGEKSLDGKALVAEARKLLRLP